MAISKFQNLLKQTMGLDAASIGDSAIERAVQQRLTAGDVEDRDAYLDFVRSSETELQELIEAVIVPETWFFRDHEAFGALGKVVLEEWLPAHSEGTLRLLSAPCSTGEEPYSMAMALFDAGLAGSRFHIDAVDISARALAQARRAFYGRNSFRGRNLRFRDRYFQPGPQGHHLAEAVRQQVHLRRANLLDGDTQPDRQRYDIIFCRNLLIYFDRPTRDRVIQALGRRLTDQGLVFVGAAETALMLNHNFVSAKLPLAFAFRRANTASRAQPAAPGSRLKKPSGEGTGPTTHAGFQANLVGRVPSRGEQDVFEQAATPAKDVLRPELIRSPGSPLQVRPGLKPVLPAVDKPGVEAKAQPKADLEQAQRLADEGRLLEAAELCETHLRDGGHTAKAFFLLGLVRDAAADVAEASEYYRKALYLEPNHYEALMHLACLTEKTGDPAGAQVLRNRARRLKERSGIE